MADRDTNDPLARDIERIHALRDQGRLTAEEAERLIGVLRGDAADGDLADGDPADGDPVGSVAGAEDGAANTAPERPAAPPTPPTPSTPPTTPPVALTPAEPKTLAPSTSAPQPADDLGVVWLITEMLAADLVVEAVPGLAEPRLRKSAEDATLADEGGRWRLRYRSEWSNWTFFGTRGSPERIEVEVPEGMGVQLDVKAGDVVVRGVSHVRGRMLAGDLEIDGASFVDVDKKAGDFKARIRPTGGRQRLVANAGDLDVVLLPGSDVTITADVKVGDLRVKGEGLMGERDAHGIGHRYHGTLGAGTAQLELRLSAGSLTLKTEA